MIYCFPKFFRVALVLDALFIVVGSFGCSFHSLQDVVVFHVFNLICYVRSVLDHSFVEFFILPRTV